jgi:predicted AAA+ superfamily ATPase
MPAVVLLGPRQAGKTTLALEIAAERNATYLDLESVADRARLQEPELYLADHADELVILDEIHRVPGIFETLRGVIDRGRREGRGTGRFLLLGSAAIELLAQSGETLAGRIGHVELSPFDLLEVGAESLDRLWLRGGFPESFLAGDDAASLAWREGFIRTYLERNVPQLGPRIPAETLRRLWTMFAHRQGGLVNAAQLARSLGVDGKTIPGAGDVYGIADAFA